MKLVKIIQIIEFTEDLSNFKNLYILPGVKPEINPIPTCIYGLIKFMSITVDPGLGDLFRE